MSAKTTKPQWMREFKDKYGIWPIGGGSGEQEPTGEGVDGITIEVPKDPPTTAERAKEDGGSTIPEEKYFTQEDIERIRKQEKDKLYGRMSELEKEAAAAREERQRVIEEREAEEERLRQEAEAQAEQEMDAKTLLQKKDEEWQARFDAIQQEREQERALLEKEREFALLRDYKQQKLNEVGENIMPHLVDLVDGNTPEEIDKSIEDMARRSSSILEEARQAMQAQRQQMPGVRPTVPGIGPVEENDSSQKTFTDADLRSMSMKDYAKYRGQLLGAASKKATEGGLYGR